MKFFDLFCPFNLFMLVCQYVSMCICAYACATKYKTQNKKICMLHFERYGKRNDQSAHTRIPANGGLFNHQHRSLFKAIVINFHEFTNFQTAYLKRPTFVFHNIIIFHPKIRMYNCLQLRDVIFLLKKTLPRFTICIENMKHSFSQSCMRHKPRTASAVHSCFSFL